MENGGITGPVFTIKHLAPFVPVVHGHGREGLKEENVHNRNEDCEESTKKWSFVSKILLTFCEKKCSSDQKNKMKFKAEGREFAKILRSPKVT